MQNRQIIPRIDLLLVDDSPGDVQLMRSALHDIKSEAVLHVVPNGSLALRFLAKDEPYTDAPDVELVLLDLNLPGMNGIEVLRSIKGDARFKRIPVVMLTTSDSPKDVEQAYAAHVNCYIMKPLDYDRFKEVIYKMEDFWVNTALLPA